MSPKPHRDTSRDGSGWPEPVDFEYYPEIDDEQLERIRRAARAPAEDDPRWKTVDGPGW